MILGSNSTALIEANVCLILAFYPDIQEKLFEELQNVFVSQDQDVTEKEINNLFYLDLVIIEVMRF